MWVGPDARRRGIARELVAAVVDWATTASASQVALWVTRGNKPAASLYAACRSSETPRTLKEVAAASRIKKKDVARCYRLLLRELEMSMPVEDPIRCISKIASRAEISMQTQQSAIRVLKDARRKGVVAGKDPMGLAAAALYVACVLENEKKTQKEIAEIANVTEVTVRNRYKGLKDALGLPA